MRMNGADESQVERISEKITDLRSEIENTLPRMREVSLAMTKLQEADMWVREAQFAEYFD